MFSIGFGEFAVICIVLIIAVGPERLPSMMKTVGKTMRTLRQASRDIRTATGIDEMMREDLTDLYSPLRPSRSERANVPVAPAGPGPVSRSESVAAAPSAPAVETPAGSAQAQTRSEPSDGK